MDESACHPPETPISLEHVRAAQLRKPWKAPKVITSVMTEDTASSVGPGTDADTPS